MAIQLSKHHGMTVLVIILLPVLISLGNWQLRRAEEKRQLLATYAARRQQSPISLANISLDADLSYQRVVVTGVFDNQRSYLLDNRVHDGTVGYEVLTPLITGAGKGVLINRGWIQAGRTRDVLPDIPPALGETMTVIASVYQQPPGSNWLRVENETPGTDGWPRVIQYVDTENLSQELEIALFPYQLRLSADQPGALITDWQPVNLSPAKHQAYAWQWFAMALALLLWQVLANTNLRQLLNGNTAAQEQHPDNSKSSVDE